MQIIFVKLYFKLFRVRLKDTQLYKQFSTTKIRHISIKLIKIIANGGTNNF